ncbi:mitochondrial import inner membrane translocase subunit TIM14-like isoform X1 [Lineus longissimus]|uniref:mitochondrial import inner membrane translocase subunit TIM14-like isoform X1 n=1 Tax=Lineus longissimus TaxID=88925 RepID=UPI00315D55E7
MASAVVLAGLGLAAVGFAGRYAFRYGRLAQQTIEKQMGALPTMAGSKYYKGGFDPKMSKREASLVLGISPSSSKQKIKDSHKKIMLLNHPDRGGSPYLAAKINEAKDYMDSQKP